MTLLRNEVVRDLGVLFDRRLSFKPQVDKMIASAYSVLGFVKRRAKQFRDPYVTKTLYCALVQSILEYACGLGSLHSG